MLSKRLFELFNISKSGYLSKEEFINGMIFLFTGYFDKLSKFIFALYDFDNDGQISKEDVRLVLSYIPLQYSQYTPNDQFPLERKTLTDQLILNQEINDLIKDMFQKEYMNFDVFFHFIQVLNSNPFIFPLITFYDTKPFNNDTITYYSSLPNLSNLPDYLIFERQTEMFGRNITQVAVPNVLSKMKPFENLLNSPYLKNYISPAIFKKITGGFQRNALRSDFSISQNMPHISKTDDQDPYNKKIINTNESIDIEPNIEGYLNKLSKTKALKKVYAKIISKDIYFFNSEKDCCHKSMKSLAYVFLKEEKITKDKQMLQLMLVFQKKIISLYFNNGDEYDKWTKSLKVTIGAKDINEYDIKEKIGIGKYGLVRRALHKKSRRKVAIKFIEKKLLTFQELELLKTEQDILDFVTHPYIIQAYDIIDTADICYIITEYILGGDLHSFLEKKDYKITESLSANLMHQLITAVFYLHYYGIMHRDLKPEHILLTTNNDDTEIKIIDFGLSAFVGPSEQRIEPYGTIGYISPEVLGLTYYDKTIDIWCIGVIAYLLLVGCLPFDDEHSEEEIKREILHEEVSFPYQLWRRISHEGSFFVESINNLFYNIK